MGCLTFLFEYGPTLFWIFSLLFKGIYKLLKFLAPGVPVIKEWLQKLWDKASYQVEKISKKLRKKTKPPLK